jgi:hypothetical protein
MNGSRLGETTSRPFLDQLILNTGFYEPFRRQLNHLSGWSPAETIPITSLIAGALSGAVGGELLSSSYLPDNELVHSIRWKPSFSNQGSNAGMSCQCQADLL